jgi:dTDP-4-amino-4,6-dideoxygalactose transaminase
MVASSTTAVRFRFVRPTVPAPAEWLPYLEPAYELAQFSNFGPAATQLEARLTEAYAAPDRQAVLVANATVGLTASLLALGLRGPVIVPAFTFPATAQALIAAGCTPVFGDIDPETWELSPDEIRRIAREQSVVAVLHVRVYGLCRSLLEIEAATRAIGVPLVIDSAAALGGQASDSMPIGQSGDVEVFSMHATKVFGIGEGGVVLAEPELAARIRRCLNFGLDGGHVTSLGINGKLSELHAAVGLAVLDRMPEYPIGDGPSPIATVRCSAT